jgi:hypothetical protein
MYSELQLDRIVETIAALEKRIGERFPGSGLSRVAAELHRLADRTGAVVERLRGPVWILRIAAAIGILAILGIGIAVAFLGLRTSIRVQNVLDVLQGSEVAINDIILISAAIFFLITLETRVKRRAALRALHRLRSIVHIVDMHQLSKDPEHLLAPAMSTASSPRRTFTRFELARYLDYCAEMLSLSSKLAALHVQYLNDPVVLDAVNDIETLAASLSNKIWQKIMILDIAIPEGAQR